MLKSIVVLHEHALYLSNFLHVIAFWNVVIYYHIFTFVIGNIKVLNGRKRNVFEKNSKCWTHWCINKFQGDTIHENTVSRKSTSNKRGVSCCSLSAKYRLAKFVLWSILQLTSQIEEFFGIQNLHYW